MSENLACRKKLFIDKTFTRQEIIDYCENLIKTPPAIPVVKELKFELRDYQKECVVLINKSVNQNVVICLPTGTGKNLVIIHSMNKDKKYLILVPRIILMEQLYEEIIKHKPTFKKDIQLIGDSNNTFDDKKKITICVFNSVGLVKSGKFDKVFVDEAHHIKTPEIYTIDNNDEVEENEDIDENDEIENDNIEDENEEYEIEENEKTDIIEKDDDEDELKNSSNYLSMIKEMNKKNNNVWLSATIDKIEGFEYYKKDIRDMIDEGYLCDYNIHVPIFNDNKTNKNICEHLLKNYGNIIIYCNSQKEGIKINKLMNQLQKNSSEYIDCKTAKTNRNNIIKKYKEGKIPFIVNVRVLVEGFDAPITKGVCFMHLPSSKTTLIQIIGRALRLHPTKTMAKIILPYSSEDDEKSINNFLKVISRNDSRILNTYQNKKLGGYIQIENEIDDVDEIEEENNENEEEEETDFEFKFEKIYSSMGVLKNSVEIWEMKLEQLKQYIDKNGKRPSSRDKNKITKALGYWTSLQIQNFKNIKKISVMNDEKIYNHWKKFMTNDRYSQYFDSSVTKWYFIFEKLKAYLDKYNQKPSYNDTDKEISSLRDWTKRQQTNYSTCDRIMKNEKIREEWLNFVSNEKYEKYFMTDEMEWYKTFF